MAISYSNFLEISITASLMIAAILLFRVIFKRAPRWVFCLMWGVVALRLVLPFSLESRFSLLPEKEVISSSHAIGMIYDKDVTAQDVLSGRFPKEDTEFLVPDPNSSSIGSDSQITAPDSDIRNDQVHQGTANITVPDGDGTLSPDTEVTGEDKAPVKDKGLKITFSNVLFAVWVTGAALLAGYFAVSALSLRMRLNTATLLYKNIKQSDNIKSPFVLGLIFPKIYLPYNIDISDVEYVLAHEKAHISRGDHVTKVFAFALLSVYWFNPFVWIAYVMFCRDIELACDEKVIKELDADGRHAYSYALLNCSVKHRSFAGCPVAFGETDVRRRVKGVMGYKKPALSVIALALAACFLASLCLMTYPIAQEIEIPENIEIENNEQDDIDEIVPVFEHTNRGLTVTATEENPTDGRYSNFRLTSGDKSVDFTGDAHAEYSPYVYYKGMNGTDDPTTPELTGCGVSQIIVNFVTEHTEDTHKEEVHLFDARTLKEYEIVDVGAIIADNIKLRETKHYYVFEFFSTKVIMEKYDVEILGIDLSGDLIFDANYRYYPARVGPCTTDKDFVCEMLWQEEDGDVFARVELKFYFSGTKYIISSADLDIVDDSDMRISRCEDMDILNFERYYP